MHSRYDVFAVTYIILLIAITKKSIIKYILIFGGICLNISYFLNQLFVYYSWYPEKFNKMFEFAMNNQTLTNFLVILNLMGLVSLMVYAIRRKQ
jgi:hypothetical protein